MGHWTGSICSRWWCVSKQQAEVVALNDLRHQASLDMSDLDECRFKCEDIWVMKGW